VLLGEVRFCFLRRGWLGWTACGGVDTLGVFGIGLSIIIGVGICFAEGALGPDFCFEVQLSWGVGCAKGKLYTKRPKEEIFLEL
jgi:hypothetical protein